jgi:hypothetical protein
VTEASPSIEKGFKDYRTLAYYDRAVKPPPVVDHVQVGQTLVGSASSQQDYNKRLVDLFGFGETSSFSAIPVESVIRKPTDEELWLGLVGIFASGDRHFAENHDEIYGSSK